MLYCPSSLNKHPGPCKIILKFKIIKTQTAVDSHYLKPRLLITVKNERYYEDNFFASMGITTRNVKV